MIIPSVLYKSETDEWSRQIKQDAAHQGDGVIFLMKVPHQSGTTYVLTVAGKEVERIKCM